MTPADLRRSVFITGAASGIGRATAQLFTERGWFVGAFDVDEAGLQSLEAEAGATVTGRLDVTDRDAYAATLTRFSAHAGDRLDILFNNAGVISSAPLDETPWETVERTLRINLFGAMIGAQAAIPLLKATPGSLCISTCSASGQACAGQGPQRLDDCAIPFGRRQDARRGDAPPP